MNVIKNFPVLTGFPIMHICAKFGIFFLYIFKISM